MSENDASKRLACFDRESARLANDAAPAPAQAVPAAPAAAAATAASAATAAEKSPRETFGYRGNIARADLDKKEEEEQLKATVTEVSTLARGELLITLDNGQVWQQKSADRAIRIKPGDPVTIKRGSLSSFLLTSEAKGVKGSMRVTRVK